MPTAGPHTAASRPPCRDLCGGQGGKAARWGRRGENAGVKEGGGHGGGRSVVRGGGRGPTLPQMHRQWGHGAVAVTVVVVAVVVVCRGWCVSLGSGRSAGRRDAGVRGHGGGRDLWRLGSRRGGRTLPELVGARQLRLGGPAERCTAAAEAAAPSSHWRRRRAAATCPRSPACLPRDGERCGRPVSRQQPTGLHAAAHVQRRWD